LPDGRAFITVVTLANVTAHVGTSAYHADAVRLGQAQETLGPAERRSAVRRPGRSARLVLTIGRVRPEKL